MVDFGHPSDPAREECSLQGELVVAKQAGPLENTQ
jgi:hypothetical protein